MAESKERRREALLPAAGGDVDNPHRVASGVGDECKPTVFNWHAVEAQVLERLTRWCSILTAHMTDARQLLRETLTGPIRFTPVHRAHQFAGELSLGALLAGTVGVPPNSGTGTGL